MKKSFLTLLAATALALPLQAEPITVLISGNTLLTVDSAAAGTVTKTVAITGLDAAEALVGIDFRPATGGLFGLGNAGRIYSINAETGAATVVGAPLTLSGTRFGIDFNPTVDRLRIISDADQNLRVNPTNGVVITDANLNYANAANPNAVGAAYTNSFSTAGATVLYDIDSAQDTLVIQNPPNDGTLNTVGPLGVDTTDNVGFDISGTTGVAYAALTTGSVTSLHTINLVTGAANAGTPIAPSVVNAETVVIDIAAGVNSGSRLLNLSTRGRVGQGEDVLIGSLQTRNGVSSRVVIRAIGPSLGPQGVTDPLNDPVLILFDKNGVQIATNDDFGTSSEAAELAALGLAPTDSRESAIVTDLAPDAYTAHVVGKGDDSGVARVDIYQFQ